MTSVISNNLHKLPENLHAARDESLGNFRVVPEEILLTAFSFFPPSTLCKLSRVSKEISRIAADNVLWKCFAKQLGLGSEGCKAAVVNYVKKRNSFLIKIIHSDSDPEIAEALKMKVKDPEVLQKALQTTITQIRDEANRDPFEAYLLIKELYRKRNNPAKLQIALIKCLLDASLSEQHMGMAESVKMIVEGGGSFSPLKDATIRFINVVKRHIKTLTEDTVRTALGGSEQSAPPQMRQAMLKAIDYFNVSEFHTNRKMKTCASLKIALYASAKPEICEILFGAEPLTPDVLSFACKHTMLRPDVLSLLIKKALEQSPDFLDKAADLVINEFPGNYDFSSVGDPSRFQAVALILKSFAEAGAKTQPRMFRYLVVGGAAPSVIQTSIEQGAKPQITDLQYALALGPQASYETIKLIIESGVSPKDLSARTLFIAVASDVPENIIQLLLDKEAPIGTDLLSKVYSRGMSSTIVESILQKILQKPDLDINQVRLEVCQTISNLNKKMKEPTRVEEKKSCWLKIQTARQGFRRLCNRQISRVWPEMFHEFVRARANMPLLTHLIKLGAKPTAEDLFAELEAGPRASAEVVQLILNSGVSLQQLPFNALEVATKLNVPETVCKILTP